jgi:hypothetical protein
LSYCQTLSYCLQLKKRRLTIRALFYKRKTLFNGIPSAYGTL